MTDTFVGCERCDGEGEAWDLAPCTTFGPDCACNGPRVYVTCPDCGGTGDDPARLESANALTTTGSLMPVPQRCLGQCGILIVGGSYCPRCKKGTGWGQGHERKTQARFRAAVLERAGHRCQYLETRGKEWGRCERTTDLQAHHTEPGNDDPTTGLALCREHHKAMDSHAR